MEIKPLNIGKLVMKIPIIQGGMGIGISASKLAGAVAKEGGIGVISTAQIGFKEADFETNTKEANLRALRKHIKNAKEMAPDGIIGVNVMVALNNYVDHVKTAIESGVDLIISGAGMPTLLPKIVKEYEDCKVKIAPIVSSGKAAKIIMKLWDRHDGITPDLIIVEGPKAGGHLGFKKEEIEESEENFDSIVKDVIKEKEMYEIKYDKKIPVIVAGGVFDGSDIVKYLKLGADGVQMGTRFVATHECDASLEYKNAYINSKKEDIGIVKSPVGMPGRAILNDFMKKTFKENIKVSRCYNCLTPCNPKETPYCISDALINAANGNLDEGLIFCGSNAYRVDKIVSVKELIDELIKEIKAK